MLASSKKRSSVPFHSNYWENCDYDKGYDAYYRFNKEQYYEGKFFRDSIHGQGTYKWNNVAIYEGCFYSNSKEGYASVSLPDNSSFEGLFIRNEPFGPGILTYANGRQDAGFWMGRKLVRLSRAVDFIIPRLAPTSAGKIKLLQFRRLIPLDETNWDLSMDVLKKCGYPFEHFYSPYSSLIYDPRSVFFDTQAFEKTYFVNIKEVLKELTDNQKSWESLTKPRGELKQEGMVASPGPCLEDTFTDYKNRTPDICDRESVDGEYEMGILGYFTKFGTIQGMEKNMEEDEGELDALSENMSALGEAEDMGKTKSQPPTIVSWNRSDLCTEMLKQIFRYRAFEEKLTFDLAQLMLGVRTAFRRTGLREKQCLQFLRMCSLGPAHVVKDLLCSHEISEELMDARGNNSLMFAAVRVQILATDQHEIIDILLDYGVDVNTFNDENLTPLNLCLLRRLAHAKGISNWETAFLPKEIDIPPNDYEEPQILEAQVSISSLDRIFGDGMSLSDSRSRIFDNRYLTPFPSPSLLKESNEMNLQNNLRQFSDESRDMSDLSQITILNINKSPGSHVLVHSACDDDFRTHFGDKRSSSTSAVREAKEPSQPLGSNEETPRINITFIPKSNKRDEFLRSIIKSNKDKYLFEFNFDKKPQAVESKKIETLGRRNRRGSKQSKAEKMEEEEDEEEINVVEELVDFELSKKIAEIDKTIQKLLRRGADPNMSEVPKPAIHLGVFIKDLNTVYNLLLYGANPNTQLYSNEGLLTPLHVVVLQPSSRELVDICEQLLNFGADPNKETHPEFSICEEEKDFLDPQQGRTPLQLLCMRPDLEYANQDDNLIKIALLLAAESDRKCFYNGHTCLTLAMLFGNIKLLKALLESNLFDPNEVLEKDRGTALHVLVSTELQRKTSYENSIAMCDLLIAAGANPLKKFKHPKSLQGTPVDYGNREIEIEKEARKGMAPAKKDTQNSGKPSGKEKTSVKDYLQDQEKVVEYLGKIAADMSGKKKVGTRKRKRRDSSQDSFTEDMKTERDIAEMGDEGTRGKGGKGKKGDDEKGIKNKEKQKDNQKGKDSQNEKEDQGDKQLRKGKKGDNELQKNKKGRRPDEEGKTDETEADRGKKRKAVGEGGKADDKDTEQVKKKKDGREDGDKPDGKNKPGSAAREKKTPDSRKGKGGGEGEDRKKEKKVLEDSKKDQNKLKEKQSNLLKILKTSWKHSSTKQLGASSETFPEKLRQNLLQMYGNCGNIDISEFLVPYVVLRDGDLYYRFHGKTQDHKEQYSLI